MTETEIQNILEKQHKFFQTGQTLPVAYRIEQLQKLKDSITRHEPDLNLALKADLGKSETESYMCEIGLTLSELSWMLKHIKKLTKRNGRSDTAGTVCSQKLPLSFPIRKCSHYESMELSGPADTGTTDRCTGRR